jgi:hypothetical protein
VLFLPLSTFEVVRLTRERDLSLRTGSGHMHKIFLKEVSVSQHLHRLWAETETKLMSKAAADVEAERARGANKAGGRR